MSPRQFIPKEVGEALYDFAARVWGNPRAFLKRLPNTQIDYVDLSDQTHFQAFHELFPSLRHNRILVTHEYKLAAQALQFHPFYDVGACVIGQPGIGKTLFLIYLLVLLLGQKQTVALCTRPSFYVVFKDSITIKEIADEVWDYGVKGWALVDSNDALPTPPHFFYSRLHIRIVQTTSPRKHHWFYWAKEPDVSLYVMDLWSMEEIKDLCMLLGLNTKHMVDYATHWGNVPRTLLKFYRREETFAATACEAVMNIPHLISTSKSLDFSKDSVLVFVRPKYPTDVKRRSKVCTVIPTLTIQRILGEALKIQPKTVKLGFYTALSAQDSTCTSAGFIYQAWFDSYFVQTFDHKMVCRWLRYAGEDNKSPTSLSGAQKVSPATLASLKHEPPPYYWFPPSRRFKGIDSALVLEDHVYVFQLTLADKHETPIEGIKVLWEHIARKPTDMKCTIVFVGPVGDTIEAVAKRWVSKVPCLSDDTPVNIAWSIVDPVQRNIDLVVYRRSDSETEPPGYYEEPMETVE